MRESKERLDYQVILLNAWHDILFGRYDNAKESLSSARKYVDKMGGGKSRSKYPYR